MQTVKRNDAKTQKLVEALRSAGHYVYREESSYAVSQAQRNLQGRTHYVDDTTMKYFGARINGAHIVDQGLLFALRESVAHPLKGRVHRFVVFDVFGTVVSERIGDDVFHKTAEQARKAMWTWLDAFDAVAHTKKAMRELSDRLLKEAKSLKIGAR